MGYVKQVVFISVFIALFAWLVVRIIVINRILRTLGYEIPVFNNAPGPCKIFHVNGSEDMDVLPNGLALISSGLRSKQDTSGMKGIIYAFDLNKRDEKPSPIPFEGFDDSDFIPHGIDLYTDSKTKEIRLFVVNHGGEKESVEIFQFDLEHMVLKYIRTVVDEKIYSVNDVVAVGPDSFYMTNDQYLKERMLLRYVQVFYPLKTGKVVFYDGSSGKFVADNFHFGNGINVDASGKYVFAVSGFAGEVIVYERTDGNDLIERQRISTGIALDNVEVDENGHLWLGLANIGDSYFDGLYFGATDFPRPCPGQVLQVKLSKQDSGTVPFKVEDILEVFSTRGDGDFMCVSTALFQRGKLLIGNPTSNLMFCEEVVG